MNTLILLILSVALARAQLNFNGNPLTEDTVYTAEESKVTQRIAKQGNVTNTPNPDLALHNNSMTKAVSVENTARTEINNTVDSRQFQNEVPNTKIDPEMALQTFLNSRTPEESRLYLDYYLRSTGPNERFQTQERSSQTFDQKGIELQTGHLLQPVTAEKQFAQQQLLTEQKQDLRQNYNYLQAMNYQNPLNQPLMQQPVPQQIPLQRVQVPLMPGIQARNDFVYAPGWHYRPRRIRGKPYPFVQQRLGPGMYKAPIPGALKKKGPVEVIYTKPPGFHRESSTYEDASSWFPDADYPPPKKDVYYSQLYAQSYDPHYYNYIAKTGKIKPYFYGKLGKFHEKEDKSIWYELYKGFKKHGLKNIMTPTFLLGMTLPVVTLMLGALVQKRAWARSDSRDLSQENEIQEYLERMQRALECYDRKKRKTRAAEESDDDECRKYF